MSQINNDEYEELFYVLGLVFIEIRASNNLAEAQILADIFHNVPAKINRHFSSEHIMAEIYEKADRHDCGKVIAALFSTAKKNAH